MRKLLVPIEAHDGARTDAAVGDALSIYREEPVEIHLLSVQTSVPGHVTRFIDPGELDAMRAGAADEDLAAARAALEAAGVPYISHVAAGRSAETIVRLARELGCDLIVMGRAGRDDMVGKLLGTLVGQVRHLVGPGGCKVIGS